MSRKLLIMYGISLTLTCSVFAANNPHYVQTKNQLRKIDNQITYLKKALTVAQDKQGLLTKELAVTEKKISQDIRKLRFTNQRITVKNQTITALIQQKKQLHQQLQKQQTLLANHLCALLKMGQYQPIQLIIVQENPYEVSHLLTFYQYIIHSRQRIIDDISATQRKLAPVTQVLTKELAELHILQNQLHKHQQQLEKNKQYQTEVIHSLHHEIVSKQKTLVTYEQNKKSLATLLEHLSQQSITATKQPFLKMQHKLLKPLPKIDHFKQMHQGVTFFAAEGTPIYAVHEGKIVFSDWLNGYGLLLIIDHGQGFMTLYAHNQALFKRVGSTVTAGEPIASVGHSGGLRENGLYFEVRKYGKAVSPLTWLA